MDRVEFLAIDGCGEGELAFYGLEGAVHFLAAVGKSLLDH